MTISKNTQRILKDKGNFNYWDYESNNPDYIPTYLELFKYTINHDCNELVGGIFPTDEILKNSKIENLKKLKEWFRILSNDLLSDNEMLWMFCEMLSKWFLVEYKIWTQLNIEKTSDGKMKFYSKIFNVDGKYLGRCFDNNLDRNVTYQQGIFRLFEECEKLNQNIEEKIVGQDLEIRFNETKNVYKERSEILSNYNNIVNLFPNPNFKNYILTSETTNLLSKEPIIYLNRKERRKLKFKKSK